MGVFATTGVAHAESKSRVSNVEVASEEDDAFDFGDEGDDAFDFGDEGDEEPDEVTTPSEWSFG